MGYPRPKLCWTLDLGVFSHLLSQFQPRTRMHMFVHVVVAQHRAQGCFEDESEAVGAGYWILDLDLTAASADHMGGASANTHA